MALLWSCGGSVSSEESTTEKRPFPTVPWHSPATGAVLPVLARSITLAVATRNIPLGSAGLRVRRRAHRGASDATRRRAEAEWRIQLHEARSFLNLFPNVSAEVEMTLFISGDRPVFTGWSRPPSPSIGSDRGMPS
ncbi:MAG: hypothetical protein LKE39_01665 [Sphaerochaeta sp.]|nr:hypothetical protein [Sphaerochaeta sp.]